MQGWWLACYGPFGPLEPVDGPFLWSHAMAIRDATHHTLQHITTFLEERIHDIHVHTVNLLIYAFSVGVVDGGGAQVLRADRTKHTVRYE